MNEILSGMQKRGLLLKFRNGHICLRCGVLRRKKTLLYQTSKRAQNTFRPAFRPSFLAFFLTHVFQFLFIIKISKHEIRYLLSGKIVLFAYYMQKL